MFVYKFLALCILAFLALGANHVNAEGSIEMQDMNVDIRKIDIEQYDGIIDAIIDYLKDFFAEATTNCLKEVAHHCKKIWYNPKKLLKCAKEYFKEHQGECAIPDSLEYEHLIMAIDNDDEFVELLDESVEARNPLLQVAIRLIAQAFKWAATHCIKEAAGHCKSHWNNPPALINCAKNYLIANKGRCALG
ncbi:uncharacterized protein LOC131666641 [Phymastichus coffea]|uniref:uncharacterized protein LOC131666641 n=1 Tax=Phymastichus coffea TaxID=108790 RepID=UPI00273B46A6|nr:uncharacterized protein LOC131666641 [Phymastichus coffea]